MTPARTSSSRPPCSPLEVARMALARTRRLDADFEVYVQFGRTVAIKVFAREVESVMVSEPRGLGVRAIRGGRLATPSPPI
jgi:predicted Zn-dependent protease